MAPRKFDLGTEIVSGLKEAVAHSQGKIVLEGRVVDPMTAARVHPRAAAPKADSRG